MLRSLYSGISGMKNFQTKLDVTGNNIANVNTYGFKKGRVTFSDLISQTTASATAPSATTGGINAKQVGLGAQIASVDTLHTQGSMQTTGRILDLAISGDGYFVLRSPGSTTDYYTRAGNFYLDGDRNIVATNGMVLQVENGITDVTVTTDEDGNTDTTVERAGENTTSGTKIPETAQSYSISADGKISYVDENGETQEAGQIVMAKVANPEGLTKSGANLYQASNNSGDLATGGLVTSGVAGTGSINSGFLEMSNVDLSEEFTDMIVSQRGFQANTKIITTSDEILQELVNLKR
ncbi:flagellar basal body rod protein FlgG [Niallia sp. Sow4_A1]|jgi:flagellar hook protein FlgE|uniref:Flagellar hook protein FlgE n=1 Tax=Niallia hominis TaxID=3133173 RepID=A0ABV1EUA4_9BACI|nr:MULTISPECIES: flagellar basal body rod protein FlgG [Bacillaceae]MCF2646569.1 flagellar basal body rod protein FlgG [Niallia circulans]MCM3361530.1 flagellar basal body rod protein FlgG [Niallia sp. MER TA 168]CAI9390931.1 Flagellar basal-body rod protein FlgG [Bacillus sp. T2.9-1]